MKKILVGMLVLMVLLATTVFAAKGGKFKDCTTIKEGTLTYSAGHYLDGEPLMTGYDPYGYNYQAHKFYGSYANAYLGRAGAAFPPYEGDDEAYLAENPDAENHWTWPYRDTTVMMKWSDEWISNKDCNNDGNLDRGYSCDPVNAGSSGCPGAWLTNHMWGDYLSDWNLVGDWVLAFEFGSLYIHDMTIVDNTFTGTGGYPSGGPYTVTWTVVGTVTGDDVDMTISYDGSSYYVDAVGTIEEDGTMSGTCTTSSSQSCTWESTSGAATREMCYWDYFTKIVTAPEDAVLRNTGEVDEYGDPIIMWDTPDGVEIGRQIWGAFATIMEVENDPCAGIEGVQYNPPMPTGFGYYSP